MNFFYCSLVSFSLRTPILLNQNLEYLAFSSMFILFIQRLDIACLFVVCNILRSESSLKKLNH